MFRFLLDKIIITNIGVLLFYSCGSKRYGMDHVDPNTFESFSEMGAYYDWWLDNMKNEKRKALEKAKKELDQELREAEKESKIKSKEIQKHRKTVLKEFEEDLDTWKLNRGIRKKMIELGLDALKKDYEKKIAEHDNKLQNGLSGETDRIKNNYKDQYFSEEAKLMSRLEKARNLIDDQKDRIGSNSETTMLNAQIQNQRRDIAQIERETSALRTEVEMYSNKGQLTKTEALTAFDYINISSEYFYKHDYYEAMVACKMALDIEPNLFVALAQLGSVYYMMEYYDDSISMYERALEINPDATDIQEILVSLKVETN